MKKKEISTVLKALKKFCKTKKCCPNCELDGVCNYTDGFCTWSSNDIELVTDTIKGFEKET